MRLAARPIVLILATLGLVACGGGGDDDGVTIEGEHHTYVIDSVAVPTTAEQATSLGRDLDGDGTIDNQLGNILSALAETAGGDLDIQAAIDTSIDDGSILLLADIQSTALDNAANAGFAIYLGETATPDPCTDPEDPTTCRQHLQGDGTFTLDGSTQGRVGGNIVGGRFSNSVPGELAIAISFQGAAVNLNLIQARAEVNGIAAGEFGDSILAGAVPDEDIQGEVIPAVAEQVASIIAEDCGQPKGVGDCMCLAGETGETLLGIFDDNMDCQVPLEEFRADTLITTLLRPDVDTDGDEEPDALSVGVGATGISGTFTVPE
jgi:hypothetical protein